MRLLNTRTKLLIDTNSQPPYAILSHRWRDEEVALSDLSQREVHKMKGYDKVTKACQMAQRLGFDYLWIDTCCIDRSNCAELSEAINSMYIIYKKAGVCIAYLDDVEEHYWAWSFPRSTWFRRGWTLQELIAPAEVLFVAKNWHVIGTKTSLVSHITQATDIDRDVLLTGNTDGVSVARRMSWSAKRETTRIEDQAYSLMGIFGVNMPIIYGEGRKAFIRLQEEIIKRSDDQSIFAWGGHVQCRKNASDERSLRDYRVSPSVDVDIGLLASEPLDFKRAIDRIPSDRLAGALGVQGLGSEYTITNHGLRIRLPIQLLDSNRKVYVVFLGCGDTTQSSVFAIYLRMLSENQYSRLSGDLLEIPLSAVATSQVDADDHLYVQVQSREPKLTRDPWATACIRGEGVFEFCERENFTLLKGGAFGSGQCPEHVLDADDHETFFILRNKPMQVELMVVINHFVALLDASRDLAVGDVFIVAHRVGGNGIVPYRFGRSAGEIYESWDRTEGPSPASRVAVVALPDGRKVIFTLICVEEPDLKIGNEACLGSWRLTVCIS